MNTVISLTTKRLQNTSNISMDEIDIKSFITDNKSDKALQSLSNFNPIFYLTENMSNIVYYIKGEQALKILNNNRIMKWKEITKSQYNKIFGDYLIRKIKNNSELKKIFRVIDTNKIYTSIRKQCMITIMKDKYPDIQKKYGIYRMIVIVSLLKSRAKKYKYINYKDSKLTNDIQLLISKLENSNYSVLETLSEHRTDNTIHPYDRKLADNYTSAMYQLIYYLKNYIKNYKSRTKSSPAIDLKSKELDKIIKNLKLATFKFKNTNLDNSKKSEYGLSYYTYKDTIKILKELDDLN